MDFKNLWIKIRIVSTLTGMSSFYGSLLYIALTDTNKIKVWLSIIAMIVFVVFLYFFLETPPFLLKRKKIIYFLTRKPDANEAFLVISSDYTKIFRRNIECCQQDFATSFNSKRIHHVFIALTVSSNINIIHMSLLAKLRNLQKMFYVPVLYLVIDPSIVSLTKEEKLKTQKIYLKFIDYYLNNRPYIILNKPKKNNQIVSFGNPLSNLNSNSMELIEKTTLGELKIALEKHIKVNDSTPLVHLVMPIIETLNIYSSQQMGTGVLCGEELLQFWDLGHRKLNMSPIVFKILDIVDIEGNPARPRDTNKTISLSLIRKDQVDVLLSKVMSKEPLIQIYLFVIYPLATKRKIPLVVKNGAGNVEIKSNEDIINVLNRQDISKETLIEDLSVKLPEYLKHLSDHIF